MIPQLTDNNNEPWGVRAATLAGESLGTCIHRLTIDSTGQRRTASVELSSGNHELQEARRISLLEFRLPKNSALNTRRRAKSMRARLQLGRSGQFQEIAAVACCAVSN